MSENEDNLAIFINNIVTLCREVERKQIDQTNMQQLREQLREQFNVMLFDDKIQKFSDLLKL